MDLTQGHNKSGAALEAAVSAILPMRPKKRTQSEEHVKASQLYYMAMEAWQASTIATMTATKAEGLTKRLVDELRMRLELIEALESDGKGIA